MAAAAFDRNAWQTDVANLFITHYRYHNIVVIVIYWLLCLAMSSNLQGLSPHWVVPPMSYIVMAYIVMAERSLGSATVAITPFPVPLAFDVELRSMRLANSLISSSAIGSAVRISSLYNSAPAMGRQIRLTDSFARFCLTTYTPSSPIVETVARIVYGYLYTVGTAVGAAVGCAVSNGDSGAAIADGAAVAGRDGA